MVPAGMSLADHAEALADIVSRSVFVGYRFDV